VTYTSADVPKTIDDGGSATSVIFGPANLPVPTDLDVVSVRVSSSGAGSNTDKYLFLQGPDEVRTTGLLEGGCTTLGFNITYDDQAAAPFSAPGDCAATATRRPTFGSLNPLLDQGPEAGTKIEGTWSLSFIDTGLPDAGPATLNGWGLRVTFAPMTFTAEAEKQKLKRKLRVEARCSADCSVRSMGDAKNRLYGLNGGSKETLRLPLKSGARRRLEDGGKAKIKLEASNDLGDLITTKVKVKVIG
jgi:hypothetical protein